MKRLLRVPVVIAALALLVGISAYVAMLPKAEAFLGVCTYYQTAAKKKSSDSAERGAAASR